MIQLFVCLAGLCISSMNYLNSQLSYYLNIYLVSFITHFIGLLIILIYFIFSKQKFPKKIKAYYFLNGILGIVLITATSIVNLKIGIIYTTLFSILGQLILSEILDQKKINYQTLSSVFFIFIGFIFLFI